MRKLLSIKLLVATVICAPQVLAQEDIRQSMNVIHKQVESREKEEQSQYDQTARDYSKIGKQLSDEALNNTASKANAATSSWRYRGYDPQAADKIRQAGQSEASTIQQYYSGHSNDFKQLETQRRSLLEQSALNLEKQLVVPSDPRGTQLQPLGTNLYVRNYYTPPQPEYVANQKKLILKQTTKPSNANK